jgi:hypothetical protein
MISVLNATEHTEQLSIPQYIDIGDKLLQLIVFNFIEYLTSTLRTNLQPSYLALNYSPLCLH